jgi:hypothetical protein
MPARFSHFFCALPKEMAKVAGIPIRNWQNVEAWGVPSRDTRPLTTLLAQHKRLPEVSQINK